MKLFNNNQTYAFGQVVDLIQARFPEWDRTRTRIFLVRTAELLEFPRQGDEVVELHGVMRAPAWTGGRWSQALTFVLNEGDPGEVSHWARCLTGRTGLTYGIVLPHWTSAELLVRDRLFLLSDVAPCVGLELDHLTTAARMYEDGFEYMGVADVEDRWMVHLPIFRRWYESRRPKKSTPQITVISS